MKTRVLVVALFLSSMLGGCSDDVCTICERTAECLDLGDSFVEDCVEDIERQNVNDDALSSCADCADDKSCGEIAGGACEAACASVQAMVSP